MSSLVHPLQVSLEEASRRVRHEWMREALHVWIMHQGWNETMERILQAAKEDGVATPDRVPAVAKPLAQDSISIAESSAMSSAASGGVQTSTGVALAQKA